EVEEVGPRQRLPGYHAAAVAEPVDAVAGRGRPPVLAVVIEVEKRRVDQAEVGDAVVVDLVQEAERAEDGDVVLAGEDDVGRVTRREQRNQVGPRRAWLDVDIDRARL